MFKLSLSNINEISVDIFIDDQKLDFVEYATYLGITIDLKLKWNVHRRLSLAA